MIGLIHFKELKMFNSESILFFMSLLLLAVLLEPLANKWKFPFSIFLVVLGFFGSEFAIRVVSIDTGVRWDNIHGIIFYILIPSLIFQAALTLDLKALLKNLLPVFFLAFPMFLMGTGIIAVILYYAIGHPVGFPWIAALIAGALLSATDPAAVLSVIKGTSIPKRIQNILEGESLFNDAASLVLFAFLLTLATTMHGNEQLNVSNTLLLFIKVFLGGILIGLVLGFLANILIKNIKTNHGQVLIMIITAYGSFIIAEDLFHVSGVMAVLTTGILIRLLDIEKDSIVSTGFTHKLWELLSHISESLLFILAGITITLAMFADRWLAMLLGITAVLISRILIIHPMFSLLGLVVKSQKTPVKQQTVLVWGGVRGAVTIALALSLPLTLDYYYTIQSIAYGVVLFSLFFQAASIRALAKKL